jgi:OOP family OmpA-OmpF porin
MAPMRTPRSSRCIGLLAAGLFLLPALGCGPIAFSDDSALAIVGTSTAPEPEPVAEAAPEPEKPKRVEVRDNKVVINEKVQFEKASDRILEVSHDLLNEVAQVIKDNPQIKKIEVQGHASAEGSDSYNLKLSDKRAKSVRKYLVGKGGVPDAALTAKGYGEKAPIADNETEEGREKNRRVEFVITEQDVTKTKVEVDASGQEKVVSESTKTAKAKVDEETGDVMKKGKGKRGKKAGKKAAKKAAEGEAAGDGG